MPNKKEYKMTAIPDMKEKEVFSALERAIFDLSGEGVKAWYCLSMYPETYQNNNTINLGFLYYKMGSSTSFRSIPRALAELVDKNYLTLDSTNSYTFHLTPTASQRPQTQAPIIPLDPADYPIIGDISYSPEEIKAALDFAENTSAKFSENCSSDNNYYKLSDLINRYIKGCASSLDGDDLFVCQHDVMCFFLQFFDVKFQDYPNCTHSNVFPLPEENASDKSQIEGGYSLGTYLASYITSQTPVKISYKALYNTVALWFYEGAKRDGYNV